MAAQVHSPFMSFAPLFSREYALLCEELTHLDRTGRVQVPPRPPSRPARPLPINRSPTFAVCTRTHAC